MRTSRFQILIPRVVLIFSGLFFIISVAFFTPVLPARAGVIVAMNGSLAPLILNDVNKQPKKTGVSNIVKHLNSSKNGVPPQSAPQAAQTKAVKGSGTTLVDPMHGIGIVGAISRIIKVFLGLVGAFALIVFVYAGVMYMTAGSSERIKTAINAMKYGALGLVIIMFAYVISSFFLTAWTTNIVSVHNTPTKSYAVPAPPP